MPCVLTTKIEIAASPVVVHEKLLDFSQIPKYSPNGFIKSITSLSSEGTFNPGDKIHVVLSEQDFYPVVLENTDATFRWRGSLYGFFIGEHIFRFSPSEVGTPGYTTFVHEEKFSGVLGWIMGESWLAKIFGMRKDTKGKFEGFNNDLKATCEKE